MIKKEEIIYAIGDVHGEIDLLELALSEAYEDSLNKNANGKVILLGDYVDKGTKSKEVIELLIDKSKEKSHMTYVFLQGNHDYVLTVAYRNPKHVLTGQFWEHGGQNTLVSYGWDPLVHGIPKNLQDWIPEEHILFIEKMPFLYQEDNLLFVHAGVRPNVSLENQTLKDLLWIRGEFSKNKNPYSFGTIIHGHDPKENHPFNYGNRIALDSGAYYTGKLSLAIWDDKKLEPYFKIIEKNVDLSFKM